MFIDNGQMTDYSGYSKVDGEIVAQFSCSWDGANIQIQSHYSVENYKVHGTQIESDFEEFKEMIFSKIDDGSLIADGEPK